MTALPLGVVVLESGVSLVALGRASLRFAAGSLGTLRDLVKPDFRLGRLLPDDRANE
jgi:hypothetical protein